MKALDRAIGYLNVKPRTKAQIVGYLEGKGYGADEIEEAVETLEEYRYIDDFAFACQYFELGFEKGHGLFRIRRELETKGVSSDVIEDAYASLEEVPDQYERALEVGGQIVEGDTSNMDYQQKQKLRARIARRLGTRGFSSDISYRAAKELVK
ncbi:MAG: regulatory protein RecX [Lentihominibacter sp.]